MRTNPDEGDPKPTLRWYQFTLRTLLLVVFVVACIGSWYAYRLQQVRHERALLRGKWRILAEDGTPVVLPTGQNPVVEFRDGDFAVNPFQEPRWLDFNVSGTSGPSKCIYRWEGERLRVSQASPNAERPRFFEDKHPIARPGVKVGEITSLNECLVERVPDDGQRLVGTPP